MAELNDPRRLARFDAGLTFVDTDAELQTYVREAAQLAGMPIALVSLVMRRIQLFRAQVGLPTELAISRATSRENSFCQFVVRDEAPFVVTDAASDPRVPRELVETYGIRSYAGVPVRVGSEVVGSLCVIDVQPRSFDASLLPALQRLSEKVSHRLTQLAARAEAVDEPLSSSRRMRRIGETAQVLTRALEAIAPVLTVARDDVARWPSADERAGLRVDLGIATACYRDLAEVAGELRRDADKLTGGDPTIGQIREQARAIEREIVEAGPIARLVDGFLSKAITPHEATRAAIAAHEAFEFHEAMVVGARALLEQVRSLEARRPGDGGGR